MIKTLFIIEVCLSFTAEGARKHAVPQATERPDSP